MKYFLVGMPGSGKSTLGKELAEVLNCVYVDLDGLIEEREAMSIPEIFEKNGQDYFRAKETEALGFIISQNEKAVISTGGGAPCFNNNMAQINTSGISIFIDVSVEELFKRLKLAKQNRPLVQGLSDIELADKLEKMLMERLSFYQQARFRLKGDNLSINDVLNLLKEESQSNHSLGS